MCIRDSILTILAMVVGTALAITMAIMRQSVNPVLRWVAMAYIWFFRGTPIYTPVSYTHLDVYKRQVWLNAPS